MEEVHASIRAKTFDSISRSELEHAIRVNDEVKQEISKIKEEVVAAEDVFAGLKQSFDVHTERLRQSYIS